MFWELGIAFLRIVSAEPNSFARRRKVPLRLEKSAERAAPHHIALLPPPLYFPFLRAHRQIYTLLPDGETNRYDLEVEVVFVVYYAISFRDTENYPRFSSLARIKYYKNKIFNKENK